MVYPGSVAASDLGLLLFGAVPQNLLNDLPAPGESGLDMGVIRAPEEIVDTDDVAVAYAHGIFLEAIGIPVYGVPGGWGDPDGNGAHGLNERRSVRSVYVGRDFLTDLIKAYAN